MTFEECFERVCGQMRAVYGSDLDFSPESPDGQLARVFAQELFERIIG